jgi:hypothetical protein
MHDGSNGSKAPVRSAAGNGCNPSEADAQVRSFNDRAWPEAGVRWNSIWTHATLTLAIPLRTPLSRKPSLPSKTPDDLIAVKSCTYGLPETILDHRPPRNETEAQTIIEHREAITGGRYHALIRARDALPVAERTIVQSRLAR